MTPASPNSRRLPIAALAYSGESTSRPSSNQPSPTLREAAIAYSRLGWPVLPLKVKDKPPNGLLVRAGVNAATTNVEIIERWWRASSQSNVGIATGVAFDVLDVDGEEGLASLVEAMPYGAQMIQGPTVATGSGLHVYVRPTGVGNRTGVLPHIDWRGKGGYVVAPPSIHPTGSMYSWYCGEDDPCVGAHAPIHNIPAWLRELIQKRPARQGPSLAASVHSTRYAQCALDSEVGKVALAPIGERNHTLNRAAFALGQLVGSGEIDVDGVIDALLGAAALVGLDEPEASKTIASGLMAGTAQPRRFVR